jgi:hypothetical protein
VLGAEQKLDGLSNREVQLLALAKVTPALKFDGKSDEYVTAAYETACAHLTPRNDGLALLAVSTTTPANAERIDSSLDLNAAYNHRFTAWAEAQKVKV